MFPLRHRSPVTHLVAFLAVWASGARAATEAGAPQGPANPDFEKGNVGGLPIGWDHPASSRKNGFTVALTEEGPKKGKRSVVISRELKGNRFDYATMLDQGKVTQSFDAAPYRGKLVRVRVTARTALSGYRSQGQVLVRVPRKGGLPSFYDDLADRPIQRKDWHDCEILAEVARDAQAIDLELILQGHGKAWFAAVRVEVVGKAGEGNEAPRALEGRGLDNLVAFTRLLGYVRYFHPADVTATTDWNDFAIRGVMAVEAAKSPEGLARALEKSFAPIAPTVRVYPTGKALRDLPNLTPPGDKSAFKTVYWRHYGVGTGSPLSIYRSARVSSKDPVRPATPREKWPKDEPPDPAKPLEADLGGGVSCRVPLALYADARGTYPAAKVAPAANRPGPARLFPTGNDRATRLAAVALAWNVFQHFYPYFDVVKTDWPEALRRALRAAATDRDEQAFLNTLRRLTAALHDGHGRVTLRGFRYQETYRPALQWDWVEDRLVVLAGSTGGLKPGDVVAKIDGLPTAAALAAQEELVSSSTSQYRRFIALQELALGARGSVLTLEVRSAEGKTRTVKLPRTVPFDEYQEKRPDKIAELKKGTLYVDLDRITEEEFRQAVPKLAKATGIIFDLRGYPRRSGLAAINHLIDKPVNSGRWHIPIVTHPDRKNMQFAFSDWKVFPQPPRFKARVAFVTDGRAISAAETFLGIIEKHRLADIVGAPTAGTNGNINPFTVPGGYRITWTGMKVLKQDGARHHGVGVLPTVTARRTLRGVAAGRDEQLERAIELVSKAGKE
jgi:C-terminal processing protease CtpA/Prc